MFEIFTHYLAKPASELLRAQPFSSLQFVRKLNEDMPEPNLSFINDQHGIELSCDPNESIRTIFLKPRGSELILLEMPFSTTRSEVLKLLANPSKSGPAYKHEILGEYGAWDRFDSPRHSIHIHYHPRIDAIATVTLMRADVVPDP